MDSLTHIVAGSLTAQYISKNKESRVPLLLGAIAGTIPDLDVLFLPLYDEATKLLVHRGFSHSLLFVLIASPVFAWVIKNIFLRKNKIGFREILKIFLFSMSGHILLDTMTNYGTQVFYPFSDARFSFRTISVVDLSFTIPLLIALILLIFLKNVRNRKIILNSALFFALLYLSSGIIIKQYVNSVISDRITEKNINSEKFITTPSLMTSLLWRSVIKSENGYYETWYSLFDDKEPQLHLIKTDEEALANFRESEALKTLIFFSEGYYKVKKSDDGSISFADLRFGSADGWFNRNENYIFSFNLHKFKDDVVVSRERPKMKVDYKTLKNYAGRIFGKLYY